jgi:hypothetical protein
MDLEDGADVAQRRIGCCVQCGRFRGAHSSLADFRSLISGVTHDLQPGEIDDMLFGWSRAMS